MREVTIPQFSIRTTKVGFGCSSLVGIVSAKEARGLIDAAYDTGIRHFDVARSYGQGTAESVLGKALGSRRGNVTITSKFGLAVPRRRPAIDFARSILRPVAKRISSVRSRSRSAAAAIVETVEFNRSNAEASLDTTLRELGTDYLDILLLHEANAEGLCHPELLEFLEASRKTGKIRGYGVGTDLRNLQDLFSQRAEYCPIVQHEWSPLTGDVPIPRSSFGITHGALARAFGVLQERFRNEPPAAKFEGLDLTESQNLSAVLLRSAAIRFPESITLFSARSPGRIQSNVDALCNLRLNDASAALLRVITGWCGD